MSPGVKNTENKRLAFKRPDQLPGFVLAMALWDLSLNSRVEPDLLSVDPEGWPHAYSFNENDYVEAINAALKAVSKRLTDGAVLCAFSYQGNIIIDASRKPSIFVRVFWSSGAEAIITVSTDFDSGRLRLIGAPQFQALAGEPDLQSLKDSFNDGLRLHDKGFAVWTALHR